MIIRQIKILESGTKFFREDGGCVMLTDYNVIWGNDDILYFTQIGWDAYKKKQ